MRLNRQREPLQNSNGIDLTVARFSFGMNWAGQHYAAQQSGMPERRAILRFARRASKTRSNRCFCVRIDNVG